MQLGRAGRLYCMCAHVYILADHVTLSISNSLVVLQLRSQGSQEKVVSYPDSLEGGESLANFMVTLRSGCPLFFRTVDKV